VSTAEPELAYADLVDAVVDRIPTESGGAWTLHAPVDPGITLVELYAYLLDQRLYWLEQAPPALVRAIFILLGERSRHATAATTVMHLDGASRVRGGARLSLVDSETDVLFTTDSPLQLLPVTGVGVVAGGVDRSADIGTGRGIELLPADGGPGEARLVLRLPNGIPPSAVGRHAGLLVRLDVPVAEIPPQWSADAVEVPPPAQLTWSYRQAGATTLRPLHVEDGTGGLRRSGIVRFAVPQSWEAEPGDPTSFSIVVSTYSATFTSPPRLIDLVPNAVAARHASRGGVAAAELERQLDEWLPLPGRTLVLGAPDDVSDEPDSVRLALRERDERWHRWHAVEDLDFSSPADRVFTIDRAKGALRFGDGLTGRIPVPHGADGRPRVRLAFRRGSGPRGNLGDGLLWEADVQGVTARNAVPATGGADPETLDQATFRVREAVAQNERAVTQEDYEVLALTTPGVDIARAHVDVGGHPGFPCTPVPGAMTVYVVPQAPRHGAAVAEDDVAAPVVDPGALQAVVERLDAARLVGTEVYVRSARYRAVRVAVTIGSQPPDGGDLRARLTADFRTYLDPLVGGAGDGWPFGEPLRPSALLRRAHALLGPGIPIASVAIGLDDDLPHDDCADVTIGGNELVHLRDLSVRWEPSAAQDGGLR
jgi:predicted phage baseplate assembly protein